jgi:hypothetical protein
MGPDLVKFSLRVWLTTLVVSPLLFLLISMIRNIRKYDEHLMIAGVHIIVGITIGLIITSPFFLFFTAVVYFLNKYITSILFRKLLLGIVGVGLTYLAVYFILYRNEVEEYLDLKVRVYLSYFVIVIGSIIYYQLDSPRLPIT